MNKKALISIILILTLLCSVFAGCSKAVPSSGNKEDASDTETQNASENTDGSVTPASEGENNENADSQKVETTLKADDEELIEDIYGEEGEYPYITLSADKTEVSASDEANVVLKIHRAQNLACFDIIVSYDTKALKLSDYETENVSDFYFEVSNLEDGILISGFTARTMDFDDQAVINLVFKANPEAEPGSGAVRAAAKHFKVGTDDAGDIIAEVLSKTDIAETVELTVVK